MVELPAYRWTPQKTQFGVMELENDAYLTAKGREQKMTHPVNLMGVDRLPLSIILGIHHQSAKSILNEENQSNLT